MNEKHIELELYTVFSMRLKWLLIDFVISNKREIFSSLFLLLFSRNASKMVPDHWWREFHLAKIRRRRNETRNIIFRVTAEQHENCNEINVILTNKKQHFEWKIRISEWKTQKRIRYDNDGIDTMYEEAFTAVLENIAFCVSHWNLFHCFDTRIVRRMGINVFVSSGSNDIRRCE